MKSLILCFYMLFATTCFSQTTLSDTEITAVLSILNSARKTAGLDTVIVSATLSKGCNNHAKYLVINKHDTGTRGMSAHKEYPSLKGYTTEGEDAAQSSVIAYTKPFGAIQSWLATFYHRIPLLQPTLKEIGIGYYEKDGYGVSLVDCISGTKGPILINTIYYPSENQKNVPVAMSREIPNPTGTNSTCGFPITIYFTRKHQHITNVTFKLTDNKNNEIYCFISTPEKPATYFSQWNSICAIPKQPLEYNTTYTVTMTCMVSGEMRTKTYSFTTKPF